MDKPKHKREAPISYRPPESLRDEFRARVENSGLSINAFITAAIFNQAAPHARRHSPLDEQAAAMLLVQAGRINDRLRTLEDSGGLAQTTELNACRDELIEIRSCLMAVLGRRP
ncbi:hypothetical protein ACO0LM_22380 [Undibacterium sp. Di26W]|uniref:hypothetical protein n=1 Tax=Undibacterium sp. Di26W TaxID=3413035 RepID=UPI003BF11F02